MIKSIVLFFLLSIILTAFTGHVRDVSSNDRVVYDQSVYESTIASDFNTHRTPTHTRTLYLSFRPPQLDLQSSVCLSDRGEIIVQNMHTDRSIRIISLTSSDKQFSFGNFKSTYLGPSNSMTIRVSFLPWYEGNYEGLFTFATSDGQVNYTVTGTAPENKYGVGPYINHRVKVGTVLTLSIKLTNPHSNHLKVSEIYTSSDFISLFSSPIGLLNSGTAMWEFPPNQTKEVLSATIGTNAVGFYTGFIDINTNYDMIVIPIEVKITEGGLIAIPEMIDFGNMLSSVQTDTPLNLANTGQADLLILGIEVENGAPNIDVISESFPILMKYGSEGDLRNVANLTFTPFSPGIFSGRIIITTNNTNPDKRLIYVPYSGNVVQGGIGFNLESTIIFLPVATDRHRVIERFLTLTNHFNTPVIIESTSLNCSNFIILKYDDEGMVDSMQTWSVLLELYFSNLDADVVVPYKCFLAIKTNTSMHKIPIHLLDRTLKLSFFDAVSLLNLHFF